MTETPSVGLGEELGSFAAEQVDGLLRRVAYQVGRVARSPGEKQVHELRVAIRRFTQALTIFRAFYPAKEVKKIRRRLKKIMSVAGDVRDCDIAIAALSKFKSSAVALLPAFHKQRHEAEKLLSAALQRWTRRRSYSKWRTGLGSVSASGHTAADAARDTLLPQVRQFFSRGQQAAASRTTAKLHDLRIAAKKLRYTLELFVPLFGAWLVAFLEEMKSLQTVLGTISDCDAVRAMIRSRGGSRRIEASLRRQAERKVEEFRGIWIESFSSATLQAFVWQIEQPAPRKPAALSRARTMQSAHA